MWVLGIEPVASGRTYDKPSLQPLKEISCSLSEDGRETPWGMWLRTDRKLSHCDHTQHSFNHCWHGRVEPLASLLHTSTFFQLSPPWLRWMFNTYLSSKLEMWRKKHLMRVLLCPHGSPTQIPAYFRFPTEVSIFWSSTLTLWILFFRTRCRNQGS